MRFETSKNNVVSLVAESEGDYMLLSFLSKMNVRICSHSTKDGKMEELNLQFYELNVESEVGVKK